MLAEVSTKSDRGVINFCLGHIHFVYSGRSLWYYSALDCLAKEAGRGDATVVNGVLSEIGTDKLNTSVRRNRMIAALGLVSKKGCARVINFLLRLVPGWREEHNERVASAARIALLNVVHECDQDAMRRCLGDWDEPNIREFLEKAIRDATRDDEVRGIECGADPQIDNSDLFSAIGCNTSADAPVEAQDFPPTARNADCLEVLATGQAKAHQGSPGIALRRRLRFKQPCPPA